MTVLPLVLVRGGTRAGVRPDPQVRHNNDARIDGETGHGSPVDLARVTPDEGMVIPSPGMRSRRTGVEFDRECILVDDADVLLDDVECAGAALPASASEALLDLLQQHFIDPSDALMALRTLRQRPQFAEHAQALDQAEQLLAGRVPRRILLSGVNAASSARSLASACGLHATELRAIYRRFVDICPDVLDTYSDWIEAFDAEHRASLISFVRDALVADMDAADPSCTQAEFAPLADALRALARVRSADQAFVARLLAAADEGGWPARVHDTDLAAPFARILMDGLSGGAGARTFVAWLTSSARDTRPERSLAVMVQALNAGFRLVHDGLYRRPADREALLDGLQAELNVLAIDERLAAMRASTRRSR